MANPAPALLGMPASQAKGQWKPGQSGNPNGPDPRKPILTPLLRQLLEGDKPPNAASLVQSLLAKATTPPYDTFALKEVFERIDGKVPNQVDIQLQGRLITADITELIAAIAAHGQAFLGEIDAAIEGEVRELPATMPQIAQTEHDSGQVNDNGITDANQ